MIPRFPHPKGQLFCRHLLSEDAFKMIKQLNYIDVQIAWEIERKLFGNT